MNRQSAYGWVCEPPTTVRILKAASASAEIRCHRARGSIRLPIATPKPAATAAQEILAANVIHATVISPGRPARTRLSTAVKAAAKLPDRAQTSSVLPTWYE